MIKRSLSIALILIIMLFAVLVPAHAEGFIYEFKEDHNGPHCKSILMMNVDTGTIVYSLNPDEPLPMASLTKIMTYIVAYENIPDLQNTVIRVTSEVEEELMDTGSSLAGVMIGEDLTAFQLLNLMMVPSGNDAALVLEKYINTLNIKLGDVKQSEALRSGAEIGQDEIEDEENEGEGDDKVMTCIDLMNRKAKEIGCERTHFMNSHGLYDPQHFATARDLMKITNYATTLPDFSDIVKQTVYTLPATNVSPEPRDLHTTNRMLFSSAEEYYMYATGIKTGSLNESGYCLASSAVYEGYTYIVIALGSPYYTPETGERIYFQGEMYDSRELYRWAFTELEMKTIVTSGELLGNVNLKYAWKKDKLQVVAAENITAILPKEVEVSSVIAKMDLPDAVEAPIRKGDVIGRAVLTYADEEIAVVPLMASESVERSELIMTLDQGKEVFTSTWFLFVVGIILVLIVIYVVLIIIYRNKRKRYKQVRRHRDM